jgi:hypothetical protein
MPGLKAGSSVAFFRDMNACAPSEDPAFAASLNTLRTIGSNQSKRPSGLKPCVVFGVVCGTLKSCTVAKL